MHFRVRLHMNPRRASYILQDDCRLDASAYSIEKFDALQKINSCKQIKSNLGSLCGTIWHPVQNQARSNFKRIYTHRDHGDPYVGSREMFFFPLRPEKFLSRAFPKLQELRVPEGWLLLSRSGTVGNILYCSKKLARCLITDHAIRIEPARIPAGYLYAFLACRYGQPLLLNSTYGSTVSELEPKHIAALPVPIASNEIQQKIHKLIIEAYRLRDHANDLLDQADRTLHEALGLDPFDEKDVEYLGTKGDPKAFTITAAELGGRFDSVHHVPLARSAVHKLGKGRYSLIDFGRFAGGIYLAPRFARVYVSCRHGTPLLQGSHVPMGRIHELKYISNTQTERMGRWIIRSGTVLVTCSGTIGRVAIASNAMDGWAASQHILRIAPKINIGHEGYIATFLMSPYGQHQLQSKIYGGVVDELTAEDTARVLIPDLPYSEQEKIGAPAREAYELRDKANTLEDQAIACMEAIISPDEICSRS
jgi:type I restriction enzyme S subunit